MSDIVERLRKRREAELIGGYERVEWEDEEAIEAADTIDDLRAENERLAAEIERMRAAMLKADRYLTLNSRNIARETLSTALRENRDE